MSFQTRHITAFGIAVIAAGAGIMMVPGPHADGVTVERTTGRAVPSPWRELENLRRSGDLGVVVAGLRRLAADHSEYAFVHGLLGMIERETGAPDFAADAVATAAIESYFTGVVAPDRIDAEAARLQQQLATGRQVPVVRLAELAERYRRLGRAGSEWRWWSRAFARAPESTRAAEGLLALCIAHGRLDAAVTLVQQHTADRSHDLAWQRRIVQLGAWSSRPELEAQALEKVVALAPDPLTRGRLIELYAHLGTPERALPHAVAIADGAAETAAAEAAARTALSSGFVDEGLAMLRRAADRAPVAAPWLARFAELALQDLRTGDVRQALETAAVMDPDAADASLEEFYRRTDQPEQLADVLQRRLATASNDARLWHEVITLRSALGQRDAARELARQRDAVFADAGGDTAKLPAELRGRAGAVRKQALALALSGSAEGTIIGDTLEQLRPFFAQPEFRSLAELLLTRHPDDPRAKPMRRELVDFDRSPLAAEQAAASLAATYPDDLQLVRFWLVRAQWADLVPAQLQARQRLLELVPADLDNRYELANLLEYAGDPAAALSQWRAVVAAEGLRSRAVPRLIEALFASGAEDDAVDWLQRLAEDPAATSGQRLQAADELFFRRSYDRARVLYAAVLGVEPGNLRALLRMGQIAAWTNDPRSAVPFFRRRLAATDEDGALVRFYLGEALWTIGERAQARGLQRQALTEYQAIAAPDITARSCMATMLARLGEQRAAIDAYRDLVARSPRDVDIVLDYADMVLESGDVGLARALASHAEALAPQHARVLRLQGAVAARMGDYVTADRALDAILAKIGPDATVLGDQTQLRLDAGEWVGARASVARWLEVQPDSIAARRTEFDVRQLLADSGAAQYQHRQIGSDRLSAVGVGGTYLLSDRAWLQGAVTAVSQRGVTTIGTGVATADYTRLEAGLGLRTGRSDRVLVGLTASPGVPGDEPIGLFAAGNFEWEDPRLTLQLGLRWHDLLAEPLAAPGLGGRTSGLDATAQLELGGGLWSAVHAGFDWLEIDPQASQRLSDTRWRGDVLLGCRLIDGDIAVASPRQPLTVSAGPASPFLAAAPAETRPWLCNAWLGWQSVHLLGDAALAGPLPMARDDDFAIAAVRVDRHLVTTLGASVTSFAGIDVPGGGSVFGLGGALTWRPAFGTEFMLSGSRGESLGRSDGGKDQQFHLQMVLRW